MMDIPQLRQIAPGAGLQCLMLGLRDFRHAPKYGLLFGAVYAFGGWLVIGLIFWLSLPYLAYPAAMGFALIAPFTAAGVYEVSRRLETGEPLSWNVVLGTVWRQKSRDMGWMALITGFAFFIWIDYAAIVFLLFFTLNELQIGAFIEALTTTRDGLYFILIGNVSGAILATVVFSVTVISFPLLMDREIDFATAMTTSVRAVAANPLPMALWAALIALCILVSIMTVFVGLIVVLPVLGHATWHMYRKVVADIPQPEAERL
ncbi:MAG: DUF2189 domain-containing protein [Hyphomicrobiales bacterium]|nr:DUF2189 domain-containing protein [Hyphomicrobiales bacterium]